MARRRWKRRGVSIMLASSMMSRSQSSGLSLPRLKPPASKSISRSAWSVKAFCGDLGEPLSGPSCRGGQKNLFSQLCRDAQDRVCDRAFSRSRSAGDDMDFVGQRVRSPLLFAGRQTGFSAALRPNRLPSPRRSAGSPEPLISRRSNLSRCPAHRRKKGRAT